VDVGAGTGAITGPLVESGARVIAVELHPGRAAALRDRFGDVVTVVRADAADLRLPRRPFSVVTNPPFAGTTALLRRLLAPGSRLVRADLVVPAHVAARWAAGRGAGAARWSTSYRCFVTTHVPRSAFRPAPPSNAAVLTVVAVNDRTRRARAPRDRP
jgi:23S rRNA (adenine-N6)-dimethyltransferase